MIRLWNRLIDMNDNRLTKMFLYDFNLGSNNTWCSEIKFIFQEIGLSVQHFQNMVKCDINRCEEIHFTNYCND